MGFATNSQTGIVSNILVASVTALIDPVGSSATCTADSSRNIKDEYASETVALGDNIEDASTPGSASTDLATTGGERGYWVNLAAGQTITVSIITAGG
jgi:hypothetical protein